MLSCLPRKRTYSFWLSKTEFTTRFWSQILELTANAFYETRYEWIKGHMIMNENVYYRDFFTWWRLVMKGFLQNHKSDKKSIKNEQQRSSMQKQKALHFKILKVVLHLNYLTFTRYLPHHYYPQYFANYSDLFQIKCNLLNHVRSYIPNYFRHLHLKLCIYFH